MKKTALFLEVQENKLGSDEESWSVMNLVSGVSVVLNYYYFFVALFLSKTSI